MTHIHKTDCFPSLYLLSLHFSPSSARNERLLAPSRPQTTQVHAEIRRKVQGLQLELWVLSFLFYPIVVWVIYWQVWKLVELIKNEWMNERMSEWQTKPKHTHSLMHCNATQEVRCYAVKGLYIETKLKAKGNERMTQITWLQEVPKCQGWISPCALSLPVCMYMSLGRRRRYRQLLYSTFKGPVLWGNFET